MEELGYALRLARERRGLTQTQVMNLTGINNKTLSGYENNIAEPDLQTLTPLLRLYRVSAARLLPLPVSAQALAIDLPACLLVGCIAMVPSLVTGRFQRWQGGVLLLSYVVYLVITCSGAAV